MARTIGRRTLAAPAPYPSAERLKAACAVNDPLRALLPNGTIAAPKGIYRFRTLAEANRQQETWLAESMAEARDTRGA